jgi:hypothetical protein
MDFDDVLALGVVLAQLPGRAAHRQAVRQEQPRLIPGGDLPWTQANDLHAAGPPPPARCDCRVIVGKGKNLSNDEVTVATGILEHVSRKLDCGDRLIAVTGADQLIALRAGER